MSDRKPAVSTLGCASTWIVLGLVSLAAITPVFVKPMLAGHDWYFHVLNAYEYSGSLRHGIVVAHQTPNFFSGLGGINFLFYPPYSYLPVAGLHCLGVPLGPAFGAALFLAFFVSALGTTCWARTWFSPGVSLFAGCAYALAPYHLDVIFQRFAYPELWGFAVAPWVFLAATRAGRTGHPVGMAAAAVLLAVTGLLHNLTALMLTITLPVFWVWLHGFGLRSLCRLLLVFAGAAALGAFYALPAILDQVHILMSRMPNSVDTFVGNGLVGHDFFKLSYQAHRWSPMPGLPFLILGAWGALRWSVERWSSGTASRIRSIGFVVLAGLCLLATTRPGSAVAVTLFPPLVHLQFPWRLLLPVSLFVSIAAGGALAGRARGRLVGPGVAVLFGTCVLVSFANSNQQVRRVVPDPDTYRRTMKIIDWPGDIDHRYSLLNALDAPDKSYKKNPHRQVWLVAGTGRPTLVENSFESLQIAVEDASGSWEAIVRRHHAPGWSAACRRGTATVGVDPATGLMRVRARGCSGSVTLRYVGTPAYRIGAWISAAALLLLAGLLARHGWTGMRRRNVRGRGNTWRQGDAEGAKAAGQTGAK